MKRCFLVAVVFTCAALTWTGAGVVAVEAQSVRVSRTGDRFCAALDEYFAVQSVVALAGAFAEIGQQEGVELREIYATYLLGLSPKLLDSTREMRNVGPKGLRTDLDRQIRVLRRGVELLEDAGVPPKVIRVIARSDLEAVSDPARDVAGALGISEKRLKAAAKRFAPLVERVGALEASSTAAARAFEIASYDCGVVPDSRLGCDEILGDDQVAAILGEPAILDEREGCHWSGTEDADGETSKLGVDVFADTKPYERFLNENETLERVPDLGDAAVAVDGFRTSGNYDSCGRTVVLRTGKRTIHAALCRSDSEIATAEVVAISRQVLLAL